MPGTIRIPAFRHMENLMKLLYGVSFETKPPLDFEEDLTLKNIQDGIYD